MTSDAIDPRTESVLTYHLIRTRDRLAATHPDRAAAAWSLASRLIARDPREAMGL